MHDTLAMGIVGRVRQCADCLGREPRRLGPARDLLIERTALDKLEREERLAVVIANVEDLDDIRVLEVSNSLRLNLEKLRSLLRIAHHHLERDHTIELEMTSLVDNSHAPAA